jgi:hypothetical protein
VTDPDTFFDGHPLGLAVYRRVGELIGEIGPAEVRATRSQVAFRRRRGLAYLWLPGEYLAKPGAEVVLSVALPRRLESPRWKEVAHPSAKVWMHHLEVRTVHDLDAEVRAWLIEAWQAAA